VPERLDPFDLNFYAAYNISRKDSSPDMKITSKTYQTRSHWQTTKV